MSKTGASNHYAQLGLPDKGRVIRGLDFCNYRDLELLDLQNGLALGCYEALLFKQNYYLLIILSVCFVYPAS